MARTATARTTAERRAGRSARIKRLIAEREASRGLLIAFEGADGSGKTTQRKLLATWLQSQGHEVVSTRWASSPLIKPLLKTRKRIRALSTAEYSLLHAVDFRHRIETSILPALWAGKTVLADRYLFTALARDAARGLELDWLLHAYSPLLWPDLVIYFSMTPEDSQRRIASTRSPRYYEAGQDVTGLDDPLASYGRFIDRVVTEYENLAVVFKFVTVDAGDAVYRQHTQVRALVEAAEKRPWPVFSKDAVEEWLRQSKTSRA
jgi:dTMP kinase